MDHVAENFAKNTDFLVKKVRSGYGTVIPDPTWQKLSRSDTDTDPTLRVLPN
jgi:hypothetical protein